MLVPCTLYILVASLVKTCKNLSWKCENILKQLSLKLNIHLILSSISYTKWLEKRQAKKSLLLHLFDDLTTFPPTTSCSYLSCLISLNYINSRGILGTYNVKMFEDNDEHDHDKLLRFSWWHLQSPQGPLAEAGHTFCSRATEKNAIK